MGKASERRTERVKSLLLSTISDVIREELADPRIGIYSITEIHLARDLGNAELLVAAVGGREATEACAAALNRAAPLIWNRVRSETDLRSVPKLKFSPDHRGEHGDHVFKLLEEIRPELLATDDDGLVTADHEDAGDAEEPRRQGDQQLAG